jgi:hypothetical protein
VNYVADVYVQMREEAREVWGSALADRAADAV